MVGVHGDIGWVYMEAIGWVYVQGGGGIRWVYMGDINIPHSMQHHMGTAIDGNHPTSLDECT